MEAMSLRTDDILVQELRGGDKGAFLELVNRYQNKIYRLAYKITGDPTDAEDVLQEVFLKIYSKIHTFEGRSQLSSWIYRIAVNAAYQKIARDKRSRYVSLDDVLPTMGAAEAMSAQLTADWSERPDEVLLTDEARREMQQAIEELPADYRVVFVLKDLEGLSNQEIADILDLSLAAVKSRLHRARLFLRKRLAEYFEKVG
jgi:RNA polymerase sigma-70 factor (ECF subfamily)